MVCQESCDNRAESTVRDAADGSGSIQEGVVGEAGPRTGERVNVDVVAGVEETDVESPTPAPEELIPEQLGSPESLIVKSRAGAPDVAKLVGENSWSHVGVGMAVLEFEDEAAVVLLAAIEQLPLAIATENPLAAVLVPRLSVAANPSEV